MPEEYRAIVQKVIPNGAHGPFAVTSCVELGSVTLSLNRDTWEEDKWPGCGVYVVLSQVIKKRAGWRANHGRFWKPSDETKTVNSKE